MSANPDIYSLVILISRIIRVDFAGSTKNISFGSIEKTISKYLGYSNNIYIGKCKYKKVIKLSLSNLPNFCFF